MLDPIRRSSTLFVVSLALAVTLGAACKQSPKVDVPVGPGSQGAKEGDMVTTALDQAAKMTVEEYNPAHVVEAVNALQPLGKEKALEQIDSYLRSRAKGNQAQGLFWVLRVLFDVPAGQAFPPVRIGAPSVPPPADPAKLPRFPILIVQDIPFLVVTGYDLGGVPEQVEAHVAQFRDHGVLRGKRLAVPASMAGIEQEIQRQLRDAYAGDAHVAEAMRAVTSQIAAMGE